MDTHSRNRCASTKKTVATLRIFRNVAAVILYGRVRGLTLYRLDILQFDNMMQDGVNGQACR